MADGQAPIGVPLTPVKQGRGSYVGLVQIIGLKIVGVVVMILLVASFTFFLVRLLPGDPVKQAYEQLIMQGASPEQAARQVEVLYGFVSNEPLYLQYVHYLWRLLHFDLGESISYAGLSVSHLVASAAPFTIVLVLTGIMASFLFGVALGVLAAMRRGTKLGDFISITGSMLHGIPQFVMALLLLYVFSTLLELFRTARRTVPGCSPGSTRRSSGRCCGTEPCRSSPMRCRATVAGCWRPSRRWCRCSATTSSWRRSCVVSSVAR